MDPFLPPVKPRTTPTGGLVYEGISFSLPQGYRPLLLDLHLPEGTSGPVPVVVWIHGGAFWSGDRRYLPDTVAPGAVFEALLEAGIAVATIDYRLSGEARFPAQLDDVQAALAYLRTFADTLGLDLSRLGIWGESAGATLAALAALSSEGVSAAVLWYPATDLTAMAPENPDGPIGRLLGGASAQLPESAVQASPLTQVSEAAPPFLLLHGTADKQLPPRHSESLHAKLLEAGARSTYLPVPDAGHCFVGCPDVPALIDTSVAFLAQELTAGALD
ncbi:alpha/beta hydrolase fold domain-containing protein [Streptacidiphilus cavernicola]|uniref:Alpha/beta hydrolase fold domain-containing protein n=1 Tax=Streptacidiphilus cavernicola TaxID=3342716 RepID=A0ABV6W4A0_9ACTN